MIFKYCFINMGFRFALTSQVRKKSNKLVSQNIDCSCAVFNTEAARNDSKLYVPTVN